MVEVADPFWFNVKRGSLVALGVATLLNLIAMGSSEWVRTTHRADRRDTIGLWRYCTFTVTPGGGSRQACGDFVNIRVSDWLHAAQSFWVLALFCILACLAVFAVYLLVENFKENIRVLGACCVAGAITGCFGGIAIGVFAGNYEDWFENHDANFPEDSGEFYWGFYLALISTFLSFLAPIMLLPETVLEMRNEKRIQNARIKAANYIKGQRRF